MSGQPEHIERALRSLTEWEGETPRLWERAVERVEREGEGPVARIRPWYARQWVVAAASIAAVLLIMFGVLVPGLGKARSAGGLSLGRELHGGPAAAEGLYSRPSSATDDMAALRLAFGAESGVGLAAGDKRSAINGLLSPAEPGNERARSGRIQDGDVDPQRAVVRKATIEIKTDDVRAAALQAQQFLSEPKGEYVESADIDDSDKVHPRADLVLRVEATRLEAVLTQLRELGEVTTERIDGEDVTDQMVDLGARLENERRVEAELLELLETRKNDKLDEVLAVRRELNGVREQIERLAAQQDNLSRMVRLSRVAVMFRTEVKEPEPEQGVWGRFVERMDAAWDDGLDALLGTIAGLVRVLVGGAIWFGLGAVLGAFAWRGSRRHHPRALAE